MYRCEVVLRRAPDLEPPILRLLGPARLEPDERAHRIAPLVGGDVDAHERTRHGGEPEVAPEREYRVRRPLVDIEALDLQAVQQVSGVLVREVGELRLGAALRYVPIHLGRELAERREILGGGRERQQHLARPNLERQVAPHQKCRQDRSFRLVLGVLEEPVVARDQLAVANAEDDPAHIISVPRDAHRVRVATAHELDRLRLLQLVEPLQGVTQLRRPLEVALVRRLLHALAQPDPYVHGLPFEEHDHVVDHPLVVRRALQGDARRAAALDVVVETRPVRGLARQIPVAGAHREDAADDLQGLPQRGHVGVRPEVTGTGNRDPTGDEHARERLGQRHRDAGVALVVGEPDVEARLMLLDEVVLEEEGLGLGRNDDRLEVGDLAHQGRALGRIARVRAEIARHARAEALGLSHVKNLPRRVLPQIHAGFVGKGF